MKGLPLLLAAIAIVISLPQAKADPFIRDLENTSSKFHSNLSDFGRALDDAARNMRTDYDYHNTMNAQQQRAFNDSLQADTGAVSQQMFQATQMQAASSGGLYNGNGSNNMGYGIGGYAIVPVMTPISPQPAAVPYAVPARPMPGPFTSPYTSNYSNPNTQDNGFTWGIGSSETGATSGTAGGATQSIYSK